MNVLYAAALPGAGGGDISPILLTPPTFPGADIYWYAQYNAAYFQEYGDDTLASSLSSPALDTWHHVFIAVQSGATTKMSASFDTSNVLSNQAVPYAWTVNTTVILQMGLAALYKVSVAQDVYVDNVVVRVNQ